MKQLAAGQLISESAVLNVATGEMLDLPDASLDDLAQARDALGQLRYQLNTAVHLLDEEMAVRLDRDNTRSTHLAGYDLSVNAPSERQWDEAKLRVALDELVNEGRLGAGVPGRALRATVTYKPMALELRKLLEHDDPAIRERIAACQTVVPAVRRVAVTPH